MKYYNKFLLAIAACAMMVSCADYFDTDFSADKPEDMEKYEYLNAYDALKTYVDRNANPNFKLGTALTVSDFLKKELVYSLALSNYDDLTAGNAMKYNSCVKADGSMDFAQVIQFVDVARNAGISIYGHTLCWHSQQQNGYLNGLIAPTVVPGEAGNAGYCMILKNETAKANPWDAQTFHDLSTPLTQGASYTLSCKAKATTAVTVPIYLQGGSQDYPGQFDVGTEWADVSITFSPAHTESNRIVFNFGTFAGQIYIDDVTLTETGTSNYLINNDFEDKTLGGWRSWSGAYEVISEDGEGYGSEQSGDGGYCLDLTNATLGSANYNAQTWYKLSTPLTAGTEYTLTYMAKATSSYSLQIFTQSSAGDPQGYLNPSTVELTWSEATVKFTPAHGTVDKIAFNFGDFVGTISVDNVKLTANGSSTNLIANGDFEEGNINGWTGWTPGKYEAISENGKGYNEGGGGDQIIEKTPEEKKEILSNALEVWIKGMMEACDGYVKAWDVVNEPMSDSNPNDLKSDPSGTDTENFYWQDYLGKDYARTAIKFARQYGGDDQILFINDYNLEAAYNNNAKCVGLINMVKYWESDGVTKIDGIATQMHVSYNMDPDKQKKQEECIVRMYELLAASGKLIKVSELDMGILDANGNAIKTVNLTYSQQLLMAEFYKFIIAKYFEIIPANQRYGITHWSPTDSPDGEYSFWRKGEPIGLWTEGYIRKPAYGGFADGLKGNK